MPIQDTYEPIAVMGSAQSLKTVSTLSASPTMEDIQAWLKNHLATSLEISPEEIDIDTDFTDLGMTSMNMADVSGALEHFLGRRLDPTLVLDYSNIRALSEHLVNANESTSLSGSTSTLPSEVNQLLSQLDVMSDEEVDGLLQAMLSEHDVTHD
ncbi:MAG: acyl carrier protein [Acaryochloris sp. RU_4_1]|nr:acyl carrier protein [Acaryochloris sp. RU_4_1]NJR56075.1 acyl carrier protein [Acaryochloris sp. CRU_2_0]